MHYNIKTNSERKSPYYNNLLSERKNVGNTKKSKYYVEQIVYKKKDLCNNK